MQWYYAFGSVIGEPVTPILVGYHRTGLRKLQMLQSVKMKKLKLYSSAKDGVRSASNSSRLELTIARPAKGSTDVFLKSLPNLTQVIRCIPKMDHHCPWTFNCVSYSTFPHFIRFLLYAVASMCYLQYFLASFAIAIWHKRDLPNVC